VYLNGSLNGVTWPVTWAMFQLQVLSRLWDQLDADIAAGEGMKMCVGLG